MDFPFMALSLLFAISYGFVKGIDNTATLKQILTNFRDGLSGVTDHMADHVVSRMDSRQKRAARAEFTKAWLKIVKKAQSIVFGGPDKKTKYILVRGNVDEALDDFYSLQPKRTAQNPADGSLVGVSGNQVFQLISMKSYPFPVLEILNTKQAQRYRLFSVNKRLRGVIYLDGTHQPQHLKELEDFLSDPNNFDDVY